MSKCADRGWATGAPLKGMLPRATLSRRLPARKLAYQAIAPGRSRGSPTQQPCLSNLRAAMCKPTRHVRFRLARAVRKRRLDGGVASSQTTSKVKVLARDADVQLVYEQGRPLMPRIITERSGCPLTPQFDPQRVPVACARNLISGWRQAPRQASRDEHDSYPAWKVDEDEVVRCIQVQRHTVNNF